MSAARAMGAVLLVGAALGGLASPPAQGQVAALMR
jgi:hypothetical protein